MQRDDFIKPYESTLVLMPGMKPKEFLKLQREWYRKAAKSGFEDIEDILPDGNCGSRTKPALAAQGRKHTQLHIESSQEYFSMAGKFYWAKQWTDDIEKRIWELHVEGYSYRETIKEL